MVRFALWIVSALMVCASSLPGLCQGLPVCPPITFQAVNPCEQRPAVRPINRTVEVQVPVPCPPLVCAVPAPCPPYHCGPPPCPPPCPTRPVEVRVNVVVRPEGPKPCEPPKVVRENPPVLEPFFYQAALMLRSLVLAPLGLGEALLGHERPVVRQIVACPPPVPMCPPGFQPPPVVSKCRPLAMQCAPACAPPGQDALRQPPVAAARPWGQVPARSFPSYGPFPR